jgi:hypothetical protein
MAMSIGWSNFPPKNSARVLASVDGFCAVSASGAMYLIKNGSRRGPFGNFSEIVTSLPKAKLEENLPAYAALALHLAFGNRYRLIGTAEAAEYCKHSMLWVACNYDTAAIAAPHISDGYLHCYALTPGPYPTPHGILIPYPYADGAKCRSWPLPQRGHF